MKKLKFFAAAVCTGLAAMASAQADESPRWLRNTSISPDGSKIAFTYRGDIFTIPTAGGEAHQLTSGGSYNTSPIWSPDSRTIVFSSDREGSYDLYRVASTGGTPIRLTTYSGNETPLAFLSPDKVIYSTSEITSEKSIRNPVRHTRTYAIDINTPDARPELYLSMPLGSASIAPDGKMLYHDRKGLEDPLRKHERSSGTCDVWLYDKGAFTKLTDFNGHDMNPVWKADGKGYYYLSEESGTINVYAADGKGGKRQLTNFEKHPVRSLSVSGSGLMAFSQDGDIYTLREGETPSKVNVTIYADQYKKDIIKGFAGSGASGISISPEGKEVAIVVRGEVYVTDTKYSTTKRITNTAAQEREISFSPDGRKLVYDSERDGIWQLFISEIKNPSEKRFAYATEIEEKPLYKSELPAQQPRFSPDGKKVAFLENRTTLRVIDVESKKVTTILDGKYNYSYSDGDVPFEWSPDSQWILISYIGIGGWNNTDVAAVKADGSRVVDLTESGYSDGNAKWVLGGKAIAYETGKYGMKSHGSWGNQSDIVLMALDADAWDQINATEEEDALREEAEKEKKDADDKSDKSDKKKGKSDKKSKKAKADKKEAEIIALDFDNRRHRMRRVTPTSAMIGDYFLAPKGNKLYYTAQSTEGDANLYVADLRKDETKLLAKGVNGGIEADKKGENIFLISSKGIKKINLDSGKEDAIEFEAPYDRSAAAEREYIYDHCVRQVADKFYDVNIHGVDWEYYGKHYRQFLPYITNNQDFATLLSELLGELNASHTGGSYRGGGARLSTAELGAFYDASYTGDGLKVSEVISGSPLLSAKAKVKKGDIITKIDGETIKAGKNYYPLLEGKAGRKTMLEIKRASGKCDTVSVRPLSGGELNELLYQRWVERNEAYVDSISGGRIAYVHVRGMDSPSFRAVYDRLLGKYRNAEAVVVDTRWNGGGWLHNDIAILLSGKKYVDYSPRGQYVGSDPFSQWTKPSVMLTNEANYSDAHGTPYTYKTLKIGKLVGAPVPGTMTAVWWEQQIDPTIVFGIPQVTSLDVNGKPLENQQLNPDIEVYNNPGEELNGIDRQLEAAVKALLK